METLVLQKITTLSRARIGHVNRNHEVIIANWNAYTHKSF